MPIPHRLQSIDDRNRRFMEREVLAHGDKVDTIMVACMPATSPPTFSDDTIGVCNDCATRIRYRPYVPKVALKLCMPCVKDRMASGEFQ